MICDQCRQDSYRTIAISHGDKSFLLCRECYGSYRLMNNSKRSWDIKDTAYRSTSLSSIVDNDNIIMEHPELRAFYNPSKHRYEFEYRGLSFHVEEREMMWEDYPMNVLAQKLREKLREIDRKEDFDWEPRSDKLSHSELLAVLEGLRQ